MNKNVFFISHLDVKSGWGTLSNSYINEFNKKDIIIFCNEKNSAYDFIQYDILSKPLDYFKNPFLILLDQIKIKKILNKYSKFKMFSHFTIEPYALLLPFIVKFFSLNTFYAIGTYTLELNKNLRSKFLFWLAKKKFDKILFLSTFTKKIIEKKINFDNAKIKMIINPVIKPTKEKVIKKYKRKTIICVGEIKPRKGYHILIKVLAQINNFHKKKFNLMLIGKSENKSYQQKLDLLIKKNNLDKFVKFQRNTSTKKLKYLYKKSHIFTMLSKKYDNHFEGFGIVYLEALNYGLPIIISKESGASDLFKIDNKLNICNPNKISFIANKIVEITENSQISSFKNNFKILNKHYNFNRLKLNKFYSIFN